MMTITTAAIHHGDIDAAYGKFGTDFVGDMPARSWPIRIHNAPTGTKTFALILDDKMAVSHAPWIHWLACNITTPEIPDGVSGNHPPFQEGRNGWGLNQYGGMAPPDKPHRYDITVYALDTALALNDGFTAADLRQAMEGHILETATASGLYPA